MELTTVYVGYQPREACCPKCVKIDADAQWLQAPKRWRRSISSPETEAVSYFVSMRCRADGERWSAAFTLGPREVVPERFHAVQGHPPKA